ncbi:MAG: right-handed parallel beta-helix repeat-containing protein [Methanobacterium sp.]|nr:right-handed parallel beta-helix repeat-containing protein [Methanobacterium sp.]
MLMILFIAVISVSFFNAEPVSAATITIQPTSHYNTTDISLNDQIQKLIDSAKVGDTINFIGRYYDNLSLIINKSLNIITNVNATISGDSSGQPTFLVTGTKSKWTNITGFNIKSVNDGISLNNTANVTVSKNSVRSTGGVGIKVSKSTGVKVKNNTVTSSKTGISVENCKNSTIQSNNVKNSANNGVEIKNSQDINVSNNTVTSSGKHGASISSSQNVDLESNDIEYNQNNGVNQIDTAGVTLNKNIISNNGINGVYFDTNVINTQITNNNICSNVKYGINLDGSGSTTTINNNAINGNAIGIDINSATDFLEITQNTITNSKGYTEDAGVGINFDYKFTKSDTMVIEYNSIFGSDRREVCVSDGQTHVDIGYNWYGSDDQKQVRICPYVSSKWITWGLTELNGVYTAVFKAGDQIATKLSGFDVTFELNNGTKVTVTVKNGIATVSFPLSEYIKHGNQVTVTAIYQTKEMDVFDTEVMNIIDSQNQNNNNNNNGNGTNNNNGNGDNGNGNNNNNGNGDNGNGNNNGNNGNNNGNNGNNNGNNGNGDNGNGNSNNGQNTPGHNGQVSNGNTGGSTGQSDTTSSSSSTSQRLERNSAILDGANDASKSSSESQTSNQQSKTAQEILLDNVNNPNFWSIIALVLLIASIVVVYYRKEIEIMYRK